VGSQLALVGVPCHPRLREAVQTPAGRIAFGPARYGRGQDGYQPMEDLVPAARVGGS